jgi:hypothetical protein
VRHSVCHKAVGMRDDTSVKHAALDSGRLKGLTLLLLLAFAICLASLVSGGSGISARQAISALLGAGDEAARNVMMEVRLPRLLAAFGVGGLLALSGVLLQALFRGFVCARGLRGRCGGCSPGHDYWRGGFGRSVRSRARCPGGCSSRSCARSWGRDFPFTADGSCGGECLRGAR